MLQSVAVCSDIVCSSVWQCVAVFLSVSQCFAVYCSVLQLGGSHRRFCLLGCQTLCVVGVAVCCSVLQSVAVYCSVLQCVAMFGSVWRCVAA